MYAESLIGTEHVENIVKAEEQKNGITIIDHEKYYLEHIEGLKSLSDRYSYNAVIFIIFTINGILAIINDLLIITSAGLRNSGIKEAIPIVATYYPEIGKIFVKDKNPNGKLEKILVFKANEKNFASLGQFMVSEEQTIQEEIQ